MNFKNILLAISGIGILLTTFPSQGMWCKRLAFPALVAMSSNKLLSQYQSDGSKSSRSYSFSGEYVAATLTRCGVPADKICKDSSGSYDACRIEKTDDIRNIVPWPVQKYFFDEVRKAQNQDKGQAMFDATIQSWCVLNGLLDEIDIKNQHREMKDILNRRYFKDGPELQMLRKPSRVIKELSSGEAFCMALAKFSDLPSEKAQYETDSEYWRCLKQRAVGAAGPDQKKIGSRPVLSKDDLVDCEFLATQLRLAPEVDVAPSERAKSAAALIQICSEKIAVSAKSDIN